MPDPLAEALGRHYEFDDDGDVHATTNEGRDYIEILGLDEEEAIDFRARWIATMREFWGLYNQLDEPARSEALERWFGYPDDAPNLRRFRPASNAKSQNVDSCYHQRLNKGEIPSIY